MPIKLDLTAAIAKIDAARNAPLHIRAARAWLKRDVPIVPLKAGDKEPLFRGGSRDPITDIASLREFQKRHPDANYGLATGDVSQLVVIDIDGAEGRRSLKDLEAQHGKMPRTVTVRTSSGRHYYFRYAGDRIRNSAGKLGLNVDVRGNGGYVVGPGSTHASGHRYKYAKNRSPHASKIAPLPEWLQSLLEHPEPNPEGTSPQRLPSAQPSEVQKSASIYEGQRNNTLISLAGELRNAGLGPESVLSALLKENETKCVPPLEAEEVEKIAASIQRYPVHSSDEDTETIARQVLADRFAGGERLLFAPDGQFWEYDGLRWKPLSKSYLEKGVLDTIRALPSLSRRAPVPLMHQTVTLLRADTAINDDRLRFQEPPPAVFNCRNGELWMKPDGTTTLSEHRAASYLRHSLDAAYDSKATCPKYDAAVAEIFGNAADTKGMVRHWHELIGYLIQPSRRIPLILICRGGGANGKTSLMEIAQKLIGSELVAAMRVQDLDKRFALGSLLGKLLLIDDDMKANIRLPDGELKKISEEKTLTGERKHGPHFTFTCRTVPVLLCNNPPTLADLTHGFSRRLMVVPFERRFTSTEIDPNLVSAICAAELPGVLNRALEGFARLTKRGRFDPPQDVADATGRLIMEGNPLPAFVDECCERKGSTPTAALYQAYGDWCTRMGLTLKQQQLSFKRGLENLGYKAGRDGKARKIIGLKLRN